MPSWSGGVGGQLVETPMGQLQPGHPELDHPPAGSGVSGARPGRIHAAGRFRGVPCAVGRALWLPGPDRSRSDRSRSRHERAVARRHHGRSPGGPGGRRCHRHDADASPASACRLRFALYPATRRGHLPQFRGSCARRRSGCRLRSNGSADCLRATAFGPTGAAKRRRRGARSTALPGARLCGVARRTRLLRPDAGHARVSRSAIPTRGAGQWS